MTEHLSHLIPLDVFKDRHLRLRSGRIPSDRSILNYEKSGKLPIVKIGLARFVDVDEFERRCKMQVEPAAEPKRRRGRPRVTL
jgi:hypothetical protein